MALYSFLGIDILRGKIPISRFDHERRVNEGVAFIGYEADDCFAEAKRLLASLPSKDTPPATALEKINGCSLNNALHSIFIHNI